MVHALTIDAQNILFGAFEDLLWAKIEGAVASGGYDLGVETVTADSLRIVERRTVYTHPATGAEAEVFALRNFRDLCHEAHRFLCLPPEIPPCQAPATQGSPEAARSRPAPARAMSPFVSA